MIIGSGMLAKAFSDAFEQRPDICIYAAGVSNSGCVDVREFARERQRLEDALKQAMNAQAFVYFGTCSVDDAASRSTPYVQHKMAMEQLVRGHSHNLIIRLPQVAGRTPNPHTLLNYLYARISRSESFDLWNRAMRNVIDVVDVVAVAGQLIVDDPVRNTTINIANIVNYNMTDIVTAIETVVGKSAIYNIIDRNSEYDIDISTVLPILGRAGVKFSNDYLEKVIYKYYAKTV